MQKLSLNGLSYTHCSLLLIFKLYVDLKVCVEEFIHVCVCMIKDLKLTI